MFAFEKDNRLTVTGLLYIVQINNSAAFFVVTAWIRRPDNRVKKNFHMLTLQTTHENVYTFPQTCFLQHDSAHILRDRAIQAVGFQPKSSSSRTNRFQCFGGSAAVTLDCWVYFTTVLPLLSMSSTMQSCALTPEQKMLKYINCPIDFVQIMSIM